MASHKVSSEKSADSLMGVSLYVDCCISLAAFKTLLIFNFCHFNYNVSWCVSLWVALIWDSLEFLDLDVCFLSEILEGFGRYFFK